MLRHIVLMLLASSMLTPVIGWSNDQVQALLAYQRIVSGKNTDATAVLVLTLVYTF